MIWVLTALYWVYNADEGNSLEDEKLTQSNLDTLLWLALPPWKILLEHTLKTGENLGAFITMKDQEMPQIKEESFKIKRHHSKNQAQSGNRSKYVWARKQCDCHSWVRRHPKLTWWYLSWWSHLSTQRIKWAQNIGSSFDGTMIHCQGTLTRKWLQRCVSWNRAIFSLPAPWSLPSLQAKGL